MRSWNRAFFIPSLLLTCVVLSGVVLAKPNTPSVEDIGSIAFLPEIEERIVAVEVKTVEPLEPQATPEMRPVVEETVQTWSSTTELKQPANLTPTASSQPEQPLPEQEPASISVKLVIQGPGISTSGKISVQSGSSVYQVLKKGSNQLDFSLKTSQHSSLGIFVEGIAGIRNNPKTNSYWLYYVNGQFASRGVSLQTVQEGDIITWSYE